MSDTWPREGFVLRPGLYQGHGKLRCVLLGHRWEWLVEFPDLPQWYTFDRCLRCDLLQVTK